MGFGFVFFGTLFAVNVAFDSFTDIFAFAFMMISLSRLVPYANGFSRAFRVGIPLFGVSFVRFVLSFLDLVRILPIPSPVTYTLTFLSLAGKLLFYLFFFTGVVEIAKETEIPKLYRHARRSYILTFVFCALAALGRTAELISNVNTSVIFGYVLFGIIIASFLFGIVYALLNCKTVYECYMLICYEGDENMDAPRSFFGRTKGDTRETGDRKEKK